MPIFRLEKEEEKEANKWAKFQNIEVIKINIQGNRGWPDRLYLLNEGISVWIEYKRKGKEAEPLQKSRIRNLRLRGQIAYVVDSAEHAIAILGAATVYVASCKSRSEAGLCRLPFRPRIGEDFDQLNDF